MPHDKQEDGCVAEEPVFAPAPSGIVSGPVHVWRLVGMERDLLSDAEKEYADRLKSVPVRDAFLKGRSGIRRIAAIYTGKDSREFRLATSPEGKPAFENAENLHFNVSHSGGEVVAAFSGSPIGIDIESSGRCRNFSEIARRFFHPGEAETIAVESDFLRVWTAKEAMLKLSGTGLAGGLAGARPGTGGGGTLDGKKVWTRRFCLGPCTGTIASFQPFEVKGWFQI